MPRFLLFIFPLLISLQVFASFKPAMIYDSENIMDNAWNQSIHDGLLLFEQQVGIVVAEHKAPDVVEFNQTLLKLTEQGFSPIMMNNISQATRETIIQIMKKYPSRRFVIFNDIFHAMNSHYVLFSHHEASFLAGYLAAKKSQSSVIGFIGGQKIPLIENFLCGFENGIHFANPQATLLTDYISQLPSAWMDPKSAYLVAKRQIKQGADVLFSPSGGSAVGALQAAHDANVLAIGIDRNQNHLYSGSVLTSVVTHIDHAVFRALMASYRNTWRHQKNVFGLREGGVDLAFDQHNKSLISQSLRAEVDSLKAKFTLGEFSLANVMDSGRCQLQMH